MRGRRSTQRSQSLPAASATAHAAATSSFGWATAIWQVCCDAASRENGAIVFCLPIGAERRGFGCARRVVVLSLPRHGTAVRTALCTHVLGVRSLQPQPPLPLRGLPVCVRADSDVDLDLVFRLRFCGCASRHVCVCVMMVGVLDRNFFFFFFLFFGFTLLAGGRPSPWCPALTYPPPILVFRRWNGSTTPSAGQGRANLFVVSHSVDGCAWCVCRLHGSFERLTGSTSGLIFEVRVGDRSARFQRGRTALTSL